MQPIKLVIKGKPVSWKNSRNAIKLPNGRPTLVPSRAATKWMKQAVLQLQFQWGPSPALNVPLNAQIVSYYWGGEPDASNLYLGPEDALQKAGVIADDRLIQSHDGSRKFKDNNNPRVEITLTPIITDEVEF